MGQNLHPMIRLPRATVVATTAALAWALNVLVAAPAAYLTIVSIAGLPRRRAGAHRTSRCHTQFVILVPAHDEERGIAATLDSFRALCYPLHRFDVHVVADNCTDRTADVVRRKGWEVHERNDSGDLGKGPALNWLYDRLVGRGDRFDAVVIVDADTSLDVDFLSAMDRAISSGAVAAQGYYSVREPDAATSAMFRFAALACRHHLRSLGRGRLGGSCGLFGNGMAFAGSVLAAHPWSGHLVEDAELQNELLLDGQVVRYVPDAVLWAEMPATTVAATSQNERWERGRVELARRYVPRLARRVLSDSDHRLARADAIVDHLVPPLSVLIAAEAAAVLTGGCAAAIGGGPSARRASALGLAALFLTGAHVVAGLVSVRAPLRYYRAFVHAPRLIAWKVVLWLRVVFRGSGVAWTRTQRNTEAAA